MKYVVKRGKKAVRMKCSNLDCGCEFVTDEYNCFKNIANQIIKKDKCPNCKYSTTIVVKEKTTD